MSPEAHRIAIAEACGWKPNGLGSVGSLHEPNCSCFDGPPCVIPDYLNDLNAMHEAEKALHGGHQWNRYTSELAYICHFKPGIHDSRSFANIIVSATASQRAEAFLKTLGLWKP